MQILLRTPQTIARGREVFKRGHQGEGDNGKSRFKYIPKMFRNIHISWKELNGIRTDIWILMELIDN